MNIAAKTLSIFLILFFVFPEVKLFTIQQQDGTLECNSTSMKINFNLTKLNEYGNGGNDFKIYFFNHETNSSCMVNHNTTTNSDGQNIWLHADYTECGINIFEKNAYIVYNQSVIIQYGANPQSQLVYREETIYFQVQCTKSNNVTVALANDYFNVTAIKKVLFHTSANASFNLKLIRTTDNEYSTEDLSGTLALGGTMYFKIVMNSIRNDLKLSTQNCYATNTQNSQQRYYLIRDRCANKEDKTVQIAAVTRNTFSWNNTAFRFFGPSDAVYITCDVSICTTSNSMSACQRCGSRKRRDVEELKGEGEDMHTATLRTPVFILVEKNQMKLLSNEQQEMKDEDVLVGTREIIIIVLSVVLFIVMLFLIAQKALNSGSTVVHEDGECSNKI